jgi:beta-glucanase (GH16 family)
VVHYAGPGGSDRMYGSAVDGDFSQWHTFAVDWLADRIVWYVDGVERFRVTDRNIIPKRSMHLAIQFDQGPKKDWIPPPDATTPAAFSLQVDWLRVYAPA